MAQSRLNLQDIFEELLGSTNVYYQPPTGFKMQYPCIVYNLDDDDVKYADNRSYSRMKRYLVTHMSIDPDDLVPDKLAELPYSSFTRRFASDNLYHNLFNLFF